MLNRYWPLAGHGSILVTSQNPSSEYSLAHRGAKVEPFSEQESLQLLDTSLGRYLGRFDKEPATRLARALGCHPLALTQIASFILQSSSTIAAVLEMFKEHEEAQKLLDMEHGSLWYSDTVAAAFKLSISRLNENTRRTMGVLCFFDPDSIPEELLIPKANSHHNQLLSYLSSPLNRGVLVKDLRRFSLINKNMETQILAIHRLVQEVVFKQLRRDRGHRKISFETALQLLRGKFPLHSLSRDHMTEAWPQCEIYLPHVLAFHENYRRLAHEGGLDISSEFIELMYSCAWYLCERGRFELSNPLIKTVKDEYQKISLQDHGLLWADICTVQLFEHNEMSQMDDAERVASEALNIREKAVQSGLLDEYHPNRANGFMNLGVVIANRDAQYAIRLHQKALDIRCGSDKYTDHQIHGLSLNYLNIGRCFWMTGDLAQAEASFQNCLTMIKKREEMRGHRFIVSAWAYWALGNIAIDKGDIENALGLHTQSMILTQEILGFTHLKTAACFHEVACLLQKTGESNRAINLLELALDVYEKRSIDVRSEKARTKYKLAQILRLSSSLPSSRWQELESDAYRHYEEITGAPPSRTLLEADFDDLVAYFYR
ncbi:hypothetical protein BDV30DRAFT_242362 [Aspergillus minisclerotigenes]|uniref:DUF7779 domain-containing protein n=1 Tax=Aspergillus minisclerotigenes TaxID=656917 RepID=A0A5N6ISF1_9EURO|nr:hypothetical protein BDV30DRAFT_242362 [Aspergillus minisclerotigenes]